MPFGMWNSRRDCSCCRGRQLFLSGIWKTLQQAEPSPRTAGCWGLPEPLANDGLQEFSGRNLPQEFPVVVSEYGISMALHPGGKEDKVLSELSVNSPGEKPNTSGGTELISGQVTAANTL